MYHFILVNAKLNLNIERINLEKELKEQWDATFANDVLVRLFTKFSSHYFEKMRTYEAYTFSVIEISKCLDISLK